jgi:hypothetical protein
MNLFASPVQTAAVIGVIGWPLAAGLAVVVWSKTRAAAQARKLAALDGRLRGMFRTVENRGAPAHLARVMDVLEEAERLAPVARPTPKRGAKTRA